MQLGWMVAVGIVVLLAVFATAMASYFVGLHSDLVALRSECDRQFAKVDVLLKERHDELPGLIATCRDHVRDEQGILEAIVDARTAYLRASTIEQKTGADKRMSGALKALFAVAENHPQVKADANFTQVRERITALEERIAGQRLAYNQTVNEYNRRLARVPSNFVAALGHFTPWPLYPVPEAARKDVNESFA
jgi:LemA protein